MELATKQDLENQIAELKSFMLDLMGRVEPKPNEDEVITAQELANESGLSCYTILDRIRDRKIETVKKRPVTFLRKYIPEILKRA